MTSPTSNWNEALPLGLGLLPCKWDHGLSSGANMRVRRDSRTPQPSLHPLCLGAQRPCPPSDPASAKPPFPRGHFGSTRFSSLKKESPGLVSHGLWAPTLRGPQLVPMGSG